VVSSRALSNIKILTVDDQADTRTILKIFLERSGAEVIAVESGPAALVEIQRRKFDVILCDIGMPGMDGYQLLQKVRELEPKIGCRPAIACTAYVAPADVARARRAGFQAHIAKPVDPAELVNTVASVISDDRPTADQ